MYAIVETGGKQCRVEEGRAVRVETAGEKEKKVVFDRLAFQRQDGDQGGPSVCGRLRVKGRVMQRGRGRKIVVFKYKPKKITAGKGSPAALYRGVDQKIEA